MDMVKRIASLAVDAVLSVALFALMGYFVASAILFGWFFCGFIHVNINLSNILKSILVSLIYSFIFNPFIKLDIVALLISAFVFTIISNARLRILFKYLIMLVFLVLLLSLIHLFFISNKEMSFEKINHVFFYIRIVISIIITSLIIHRIKNIKENQ